MSGLLSCREARPATAKARMLQAAGGQTSELNSAEQTRSETPLQNNLCVSHYQASQSRKQPRATAFCNVHMIQHLGELSHQSMCTAAEGDQVAVTVCHCTQQCVDLLLTDGRIDDIAELAELLLGQPALLLVINQSEGIYNGSQRTLMQLKIPPQQDLQPTSN